MKKILLEKREQLIKRYNEEIIELKKDEKDFVKKLSHTELQILFADSYIHRVPIQTFNVKDSIYSKYQQVTSLEEFQDLLINGDNKISDFLGNTIYFVTNLDVHVNVCEIIKKTGNEFEYKRIAPLFSEELDSASNVSEMLRSESTIKEEPNEIDLEKAFGTTPNPLEYGDSAPKMEKALIKMIKLN